jgi:hypothetical protein
MRQNQRIIRRDACDPPAPTRAAANLEVCVTVWAQGKRQLDDDLSGVLSARNAGPAKIASVLKVPVANLLETHEDAGHNDVTLGALMPRRRTGPITFHPAPAIVRNVME